MGVEFLKNSFRHIVHEKKVVNFLGDHVSLPHDDHPGGAHALFHILALHGVTPLRIAGAHGSGSRFGNKLASLVVNFGTGHFAEFLVDLVHLLAIHGDAKIRLRRSSRKLLHQKRLHGIVVLDLANFKPAILMRLQI
jgi:hypothetical protein